MPAHGLHAIRRGRFDLNRFGARAAKLDAHIFAGQSEGNEYLCAAGLRDAMTLGAHRLNCYNGAAVIARRLFAGRPPHPSPLPRGERESGRARGEDVPPLPLRERGQG